MSTREHHAGHEAVGAYVLGVLDSADAARFETHLAGCDDCGRRLDELAGLEPLLAELAATPPDVAARPGGVPHPADPPPRPTDGPAPLSADGPAHRAAAPSQRAGRPPRLDVATVTARPGTGLFDRMVDEVATARRTRRRRGLYLVAAAAALAIGGPVATVALTSDGGSVTAQRSPGGAAAAFRRMPEKAAATDPATGVSARLGMEPKAWGTDAILELRNVRGPLTCRLVAVSRDGEEQTMTTWAVPTAGYGLPGSEAPVARRPLYAHGGTGLRLDDITRFEVRADSGERLVSITS